MCKFSVIIPNYNKGEYVKECLDNIFAQTLPKEKLEIIVIDDGSTDNSLEIIKQYPVKLFQTNRLGAGGARNVGLDNAQGEYIVFMDSDDYLSNTNVLSKLDEMTNGEDIIFLSFKRDEFGDATIISEEHNSLAEKIEKTTTLGVPTKCFKRELIGDTRFPEKVAYEDVCFTLECLCKCKDYAYFEEPFYTYRRVKNSNTTQEVSGKIMTDLIREISNLYYLCFKYPQYKNNILNRIKKDNLPLRLQIINELIETGNNNFRKYF